MVVKQDNDNKNDVIVNFLRQLQIKFNQHYKDLSERKQEKIEAVIKYWLKEMSNNAEQGPEIIYYD